MDTTVTPDSGLHDTFAYEVDDYNTICRSGYSNSGYLTGSKEKNKTDVSFESLFADTKTLSVFTNLLENARQSMDAVSFPYRCDTDSACHYYQLTVSISTARHVLFFNKLLGSDPRPNGPIWKRKPGTGPEAHQMCSICNQILFEERWLYFQELVEGGIWTEASGAMTCSTTVCNACERGITQRILQSKRSLLQQERQARAA